MAAGASETPLVWPREGSLRTGPIALNRRKIAPRQTRMTGTTTTRRGLSSGEEFLVNGLMGGETPSSVFGSAPIETVRLIAPVVIDLVNIHTAAGEIEIPGKRKCARRPIISQRGRLVR